jgi:hypothetical protein
MSYTAMALSELKAGNVEASLLFGVPKVGQCTAWGAVYETAHWPPSETYHH